MKATMIVNKVLQMPAYQEAQSLAIFLSMPGREVSTRGIVLHALDHGKSIFIPYLHPGKIPKSKVMDMLQLRSKEDFHALQPDAWGIPSLSKDSVDTRKNALGGYGVSDVSSTDRRRTPVLDLVFMPAVAFDQSYNRLGHGKGFYDRYLARYKIALHSSQTARPMPRLGECFVVAIFSISWWLNHLL